MPQPERRGGAPTPESEPLPSYSRAARFAGEEPSGQAYFAAQEVLYTASETLELSAYRFQLERVYHVAVLGDPPPGEIDAQLAAILSTGEQAVLPEEVSKILNRR